MKNTKKGFTLVELVIVIAVIAILAGITIGAFSNVMKNANISKGLQSWRYAVDQAYLEYVSTYNEEPKYVNITGGFEFVKEATVNTSYIIGVEGPVYVKLADIDESTVVCLIKTAAGLRVVTGTISGTSLTYEKGVTAVDEAAKKTIRN